MTVRRRETAALAAAGVAFFASGVAALVYQVTWQRILALHTGIGIYSIAVIVASFMLGLGLGSHAGGALSLRLGRRGALAAFALVEVGIATWGALSCTLYYDWLYGAAIEWYTPLWRAALLHLASLAPPTLLMGMSLPLLVRGMVLDAETASRRIGLLYAVNVLGAATGAALTPWVLLRFLGFEGATLFAAAANGLAALTVPLLIRLAVPRPQAPVPASTTTPVVAAAGPARAPFRLWLALYAASGGCALSLEIVWFRLMDVAVRSTPFTFGSLLCFYLLGCGIGTLAGSAVVARVRRPLRAFLLAQCLLLLYSGAVVVAASLAPDGAPGLRWLSDYWAGPTAFGLGAAFDWDTFFRLYVALPAVLFGPPTLLMGFSFPVLQRAVQDDPATSGRKVGMLQAANILGCTLGSLLVGLVLFDAFGSSGTLRLLVGAGLAFAAVGVATSGWRSPFPALAAALLATAWALPGQDALWQRLHGRGAASLVDEDATGVAALVPEGPERWGVVVSGRRHSWIPFGGIHTRLGALPALVHPAPREVAIIGLGSGDTAWASGLRRETERVDVFEISGPQPRLLERLAGVTAHQPQFEPLRALLADPRIRVRVADGRNALLTGERRYDVIQADALTPDMAFSGNLYSREFFELVRSRLKPGGMMCTWLPTLRVYRTFRSVFPHVVRIDGLGAVVGSDQPIPLDHEAWIARVRTDEVRAYLGPALAESLVPFLSKASAPVKPPAREHALNEDLFPRDEFATP
ncbi:MAG: fused MFS/spermidine synthase [Vicinamibacteria bacterium]|nr:fused MFS/spermidine synthase [Vicinamibacteria bacterium]